MSGFGRFLAELALDVVDPLPVGLQQPAHERQLEDDRPRPVGDPPGPRFERVAESLEPGQLVAERMEAAQDGRHVSHVGGEEADRCLVLDVRVRRRLCQPGAETLRVPCP